MRANLLCHNKKANGNIGDFKNQYIAPLLSISVCKMFQLYSNSELFKLNVISLENII